MKKRRIRWWAVGLVMVVTFTLTFGCLTIIKRVMSSPASFEDQTILNADVTSVEAVSESIVDEVNIDLDSLRGVRADSINI